MTNAARKQIKADLGFLDKGRKYVATVYADATDADWQKNLEAYKIYQVKVDSKSNLTLTLAPGGGAAVSIRPL